MKKFLCATDHSEIAQKAEVFAAQFAKNFGADLTFVYVSHIREQDLDPKAAHSSIEILKETALIELSPFRSSSPGRSGRPDGAFPSP